MQNRRNAQRNERRRRNKTFCERCRCWINPVGHSERCGGGQQASTSQGAYNAIQRWHVDCGGLMTTAKGYDWECEECGAHVAKTSRSSQFERDLYTFTGTREQYERFQDDIDQDDDGCYHCCERCRFGGSRPDIYHHRKR